MSKASAPPPLPSETPPDEPAPTQPRKPRPNFGCLGCFWTFSLFVFTAVAAGALWWLNPMWFDRMAMWRGPVLSEQTVFIAADDTRSDIDVEMQRQKRIESGIERWPGAAVNTGYSPQSGATLQTIEGTMLQFPPGAMTGQARIEAVPVVGLPEEIIDTSGGPLPVGPLHDVRVDGRAHTVFSTPVRVRVPIDAKSLPAGVDVKNLRVGSYAEGKWEAVPSRLDPGGKFVEGEVQHASLIGAVAIGTGAVALVGKFTETGRTLRRIIAQRNTYAKNVYDTDNFSIYYGDGTDILQDGAYPLTAGRASDGVPCYVKDVGRWIEDAREHLDVVGMSVGRGVPHRWGVFLAPLDNFGSTALGGPVIIDNDMLGRNETSYPPDLEYRIHNTVVHELIHVAQDDFFNASNATGQEWWIESTAEYLGNKYLALRGGPKGDKRYYVRNDFRMLETPLDEATAERPYAYASFYEFLDEQRGMDVVAAIKRTNEMGAPKLLNVSRGFGEDFGDGFIKFAKAFYHDNLWQDRFASPQTVAADLNTVEVFTHLSATGGQQGAVRLYTYVERQLPMKHLTAQYFNFHAPRLPADIDAKLVIHFPNAAGNPAGHDAFVSAIREPRTFPLRGSPTELEWINISAANQSAVFDITESSHADAKKASQVSLLVINHSALSDGPELTVRRWLLLPPDSGSFKRLDNGHYALTWQTAILRQQDRGGKAFKGYNVYRRKSGDKEFPATPLNTDGPLTVETWTDEHVPNDGANYTYGVTVVDQLDNESDHRVLDNEDPFEGVWTGKVILVKGSITDPVERWAKQDHEKDRKDYQQRIASEQDADARARLQRQWDDKDQEFEKDLKTVLEALDKFEEVARFGIPATFRVKLEDGKYYLKFEKFLGIETKADDKDAVEMRRNTNALMTVEQLDNVSPLILRLHRADEINSTWEWSGDTEVGNLSYGIRFDFKRE
ncbi:MAG: hypothetical protein GC159_00350 [Phycisphaera sp.]|nr:hypothetical protein [Phycisphaera sp.]